MRTALPIAGISKHQYYYRAITGKPGRKPSCTTLCKEGNHQINIENTAVVERIKSLHSNPDLAYGYHGTTQALRQQGLIINHKKVYRIMDENNLLQPLTPNDFEKLWNDGHIQISSNIKQRRIVFKLKIPRHQINRLTGNNEPEGSSSQSKCKIKN